MVIIGIVGAVCAGKRTVAELLQAEGFQVFDLRECPWTEVTQTLHDSPAHNFVVFPVTLSSNSALKKFTFYKLLWVDAALTVRFQRYLGKRGQLSIEEFVRKDDEDSFGGEEGGYDMWRQATRVVNNEDKGALKDRVSKVPQTCKKMRKNWDSFYMSFACLAARRSNCMKSPVGAVIVSDNRIVSSGYNGTPVGFDNCISGGCKRCNENSGQGKHLDKCYCVHAEVNSILYAGRYVCQGGTMYATMMPCLNCAKTIVQVGIKRVVFREEYSDEDSKGLLGMVGIGVGMLKPEDNPYLV